MPSANRFFGQHLISSTPSETLCNIRKYVFVIRIIRIVLNLVKRCSLGLKIVIKVNLGPLPKWFLLHMILPSILLTSKFHSRQPFKIEITMYYNKTQLINSYTHCIHIISKMHNDDTKCTFQFTQPFSLNKKYIIISRIII